MPRPPRYVIVVAIAVVLVASAAAAVGTFQPLAPAGDLTVADDVSSVLLEEFGESGSHVLRYEDGADLTYAFTLRNTGPVGVSVTDIPTGGEQQRVLVESVAAGVMPSGEHFSGESSRTTTFERFALSPGEERDVVVHARFDNCEYYTERAIHRVTGHDVRLRVAGIPRTVTVPFERPLLVRSPTIRRCPERSMDRGDRRRTDP